VSDIREIKNQLKIIKIIHISLISGVILFFIVAVMIIQSNKVSGNKELDSIFTIVVPAYGLLMMYFSRTIFNLLVSKFSAGSNLSEKIAKFRLAKIICWALVESACLFALVATLLTSNYLYVVVFIFLFGYFFMLRLSKQSLKIELQLSPEEMNLIFN